MSLNNWLDGELNRLETQRQEYIEKHYRERFYIEEGENKITFYIESPREDKMFGRFFFRIQGSNGDLDVAIAPKSPLYHMVLKAMKQGVENGLKIVSVTFIRTGVGKQTRYTSFEVLGVKKEKADEKTEKDPKKDALKQFVSVVGLEFKDKAIVAKETLNSDLFENFSVVLKTYGYKWNPDTKSWEKV